MTSEKDNNNNSTQNDTNTPENQNDDKVSKEQEEKKNFSGNCNSSKTSTNDNSISSTTNENKMQELVSADFVCLNNTRMNEDSTMRKVTTTLPISKIWNVDPKKLDKKPRVKKFVNDLKNKYVMHLLNTTTSEKLEELKKEDDGRFSEDTETLCESVQELLESLDEEEYLLDKFYILPSKKCSQKKINNENSGFLMDQNEQHFINTNENLETDEMIQSGPTISSHLNNDSSSMHENNSENISNDDEMHNNLRENNNQNNLHPSQHCEEENTENDSDNKIDEIVENNLDERDQKYEEEFSEDEKVEEEISEDENEEEEFSEDEVEEEEEEEEDTLLEQKEQMHTSELANNTPIKNGSLNFNQHHHIVVGKYNSNLLKEKDILKCKVMKASRISAYVGRVNQRTGKIMKRSKDVKKHINFYNIEVNFRDIVSKMLLPENIKQSSRIEKKDNFT
jgi:hypothetical protein